MATTVSSRSAAEIISMRPLSQSLPMALLQAREQAMQLFRPLLAEHDLTEQQWRVLRTLTATNDAMDVSAVAQATFLLAPSLSRILSHLERRGLVNRATARDDQRRFLISLSDDGRSLVALIAPQSEERYRYIERRFGKGRLEALLSELHHLTDLDLDDNL